MIIKAIVAVSDNGIIGNGGDLPWHIPEDLKRVSKLTTGHYVLMGRKTFDSLPEKYKPLPNRDSIILTSNQNLDFSRYNRSNANVFKATSLEEAVDIYKNTSDSSYKTLWVFGGATIYKQALPLCSELHLTKVHINVAGDTLMPDFEKDFEIVSEEKFSGYTFLVYKKL